MELEYGDTNRRRSRLLIGAGILIAMVAAGAVFFVLRGANLSGGGEQVETREVVVAARDIASREPIEEGDVTMRSVPADATNATAYSRIDEVLGRVSGVGIPAGQLITVNLLASASSGQAFSLIDPGAEFDPEGPDWRAVSVTVPDDKAVGGTLTAGQRVDLIATMPINPEIGQPPADETVAATFVPGPSTKVTLQNLDLLARNGAIYVLRAELATAEKIAELAAAGGQFTLVLRADPDVRTADTEGSTVDRLIEEFGFPIPRPPAGAAEEEIAQDGETATPTPEPTPAPEAEAAPEATPEPTPVAP